MLAFSNGVKDILAAWNNTIQDLGPGIPDPDQQRYPALHYSANQLVEISNKSGGSYNLVDFKLILFDMWPQGCDTWEGAQLKAEADIELYQRYLRTFLYILTNPSNKFKFSHVEGQKGAITYRLYPFEVTEDNLIAVAATGTIRYNVGLDCCDSSFYDDTNLLKPGGWATN